MMSNVADVTAELIVIFLTSLKLDRAMDKKLHKKSVHAGHHGGFIGCKSARKNTAENDDDEHQGPEPLFQNFQDFYKRRNRHPDKIGSFPVNYIGVYAYSEHDHDSRQEPGKEKAFQRNIADHAVQNHPDAGRDNDAEVGRGGHNTDGVLFAVSIFNQRGDHESAQSHHGCHGRSGNGAEKPAS